MDNQRDLRAQTELKVQIRGVLKGAMASECFYALETLAVEYAKQMGYPKSFFLTGMSKLFGDEK